MKLVSIYKKAVVLLVLMTTVTGLGLLAAEQQKRPPMDKTALIKMMREMRDDESRAEQLLYRLDQLSDKDKQDEVLLNELFNLGNRFALAEKISVAKRIMFKCVELYEKSGLEVSHVDMWQSIGNMYMREGALDSAKWYLRLSEGEWQRIGSGEENPYILHSKALICEIEGKTLEAAQLLTRSLELFRQRGLLQETAATQYSLGRLYRTTRNYDKAMHHLLAARRYFKKTGIGIRELLIGIEIASVYKVRDSIAQAIVWNQSNISLARALDNQVMLAMTYMNLGNVYNRAGKYTEALACLDSSYHYSQKLGLSFGEMLYHINKAELYNNRKQPVLALREIALAEKGIRAVTDPGVLSEYYETLYEAHKQNNDPVKALQYYELSTVLRDSMDTEGALHFMLEWEGLIEKERTAKEIAELNLSVSRARLQTVVILSAVIILGVLLFLWLYVRARKEKEERRLAEDEKKRLSLDVEFKNRELAMKAVLDASMSELVLEIVQKLKRLSHRVNREAAEETGQIIRDLETRIPGEQWKEFETRFTQVHEDFNDKLLQICPDLSPVELKVCSLLRLNMSTKEIVLLTNRSQSTIINTRSQIRKKLKLSPEENLTSYLLSL